jgi:Methyltransferase domain
MFKRSIKKINPDYFINRLRCSVIGEGMLHEGNIYLMDFAVRNMPENGIVLEIGCYGGLSTNLLVHLLKKHNRNNQLYGCDAWIYEGFFDYSGTVHNHIDGREDIDRKDYMEYIKKSFIQSTQFLHADNLPFTCHLRSDDFFKNWNSNTEFTDVFGRSFKIDSKIAFAYIDGDHSYHQTKKDFENVNTKLLVNGFVLIDDSARNMKFGSAKFIKELLKNPNYKCIDYNPNYLFQKIK